MAKRPTPTMLRTNSIKAVIRHVFEANDHNEAIPPVRFVDALPEHYPCGTMAVAYPAKLRATFPGEYGTVILVLRSAYEAMDPYTRQLTIAHEACHFVTYNEERFGGDHCVEWVQAMEDAGYEDLDVETEYTRAFDAAQLPTA